MTTQATAPAAPLSEQPIVGWEAIHRQCCMATGPGGKPIPIWSMHKVRSYADDLERAGAILRTVVPFPDGIRRKAVLCWPSRFVAAMQVITIKERESKA